MTRRLRIAIGSAIILVGLLAIVVLSFLGVTHTSVGQERVRSMVATMLEGKVKGKVYIGHMSGGLVGGVRIDSVEILLGNGPGSSLPLHHVALKLNYGCFFEIERRVVSQSGLAASEWI